MVIAERLRALREAKNLSRGDIEKRMVRSAVVFRVSRTAIRSRRSKRWKGQRGLW
jgi:hypothetical protein